MADKIHSRLKNMLSEDRYNHSIGVRNTAVELAKIFHADIDKACTAGFLHDCAKDFSDDMLLKYAKEYDIELNDVYKANPQLLHGPVGSFVIQHEFMIDDPDIIHSIYYHTTGCENMSILDKIIYIADLVEPGRNFPGVGELRKASYDDLDTGVYMAMENTIRYIIEKKQLIDILTVKARNSMLIARLKGAD